MRYSILLTIYCCYCLAVNAQEPDSATLRKKLSPLLLSPKARIDNNALTTWWVVVTDIERFKTFVAENKLPVEVMGAYIPTRLVVIKTTRKVLLNNLLKNSWVVFADAPRIPREEQVISSFDNTANQVNTIHSLQPALNGNGLVVSVKENKPDTTDIDFTGRYLPTPLSSSTVTQHAGIMSTIIGGGGNSDYTGKGAAWGITLSSSSFATLLPDANSAYQQYNISVQNHSYGTGIENYYGADAAAYDASSIANAHLLHSFSAGNSGNQTSTQGPYTGIPNYANITGSFKMGKNMITTGAINSLYQPEALSSRGPAYDGRIKPELAAFGEDGSSGAAAITSGIGLLVQQAYKEQTGQLPPAALVKTILLNTADDVAAPGIDFQTGYGSVNAFKAIGAVHQGLYAAGHVAQAQTQTTTLSIPAGIRQVKVTLCWYDVPATPNAPKALVNDLDLELIHTSTGEHWQPWVLSHFPHADSLQKLPARKRDSLNNNEQITLDNPLPGTYTIQVKGYAIPSGAQAYSLSWRLDTADRFQWYYPAKGDYVQGGRNNILRWASSFTDNNPGHIEYSTDDGTHWQSITHTANLAQGFYTWQAPDTFTTARLRITAGAHSFLSDIFTISSRLDMNTGFNCTDSFLLTWHKPAGIEACTVYVLGEKYLQPLLTTGDTMLVLGKAANPALHYTVAPVLADGYTGMKAFTFNYTTQGIGCYIKSFLADFVNATTARLLIELGTRYAIQKITIEKLGISGYRDIQTIEPVNALQYVVTDNALHRGVNTYRLKIYRTDGVIIYSQPETVYNFKDAGYIVYPNPVSAATPLHILTADPGNSTITFFNAAGQQVLHRQLTDVHEQLPLHGLQKGLYFYIIRRAGNKEQTGSMLIY